VGGHVQRVEELDVAIAAAGADDAGGRAAGVGPAGFEPADGRIERDAARGQLPADRGRRFRCRRGPPAREQRIRLHHVYKDTNDTKGKKREPCPPFRQEYTDAETRWWLL